MHKLSGVRQRGTLGDSSGPCFAHTYARCGQVMTLQISPILYDRQYMKRKFRLRAAARKLRLTVQPNPWAYQLRLTCDARSCHAPADHAMSSLLRAIARARFLGLVVDVLAAPGPQNHPDCTAVYPIAV